MDVPITGMPRRVSSVTASLFSSVLSPIPVTARSRSEVVVIRSSCSTVCSQWAPVRPGLASTSRIAGPSPLESWLALHWARYAPWSSCSTSPRLSSSVAVNGSNRATVT